MLIKLSTAKCGREGCEERNAEEFETKACGAGRYGSSLPGLPRGILGSGPDPAADLVPPWPRPVPGDGGARPQTAGSTCSRSRVSRPMQLPEVAPRTAAGNNKGKSWLRCFLSTQCNATGFCFHRGRRLPPRKKKEKHAQ